MRHIRVVATACLFSTALAGAAMAQVAMTPNLTNTPSTSSKDAANNTLTGKTPGTGNIQTQNTLAMKKNAKARATAKSAKITGTATTPMAQ